MSNPTRPNRVSKERTLSPPGKEASFIKQTIRWQIDLVMYVQDASAGEIGGRNVEPVPVVLIDEAYHKVKILTRFEEMFENRVLCRWSVRDGSDQILDDIAG